MKKIVATGKSEHMPKGVVYEESAEMADLLVSIGAAVYEGTDVKLAEANEKKGAEISTKSAKKSK